MMCLRGQLAACAGTLLVAWLGHPCHSLPCMKHRLEHCRSACSCQHGRLAALAEGRCMSPLCTHACRYSAIIQNGQFKTFNLEPEGGGLSCSLAATALDQLKEI